MEKCHAEPTDNGDGKALERLRQDAPENEQAAHDAEDDGVSNPCAVFGARTDTPPVPPAQDEQPDD
jgi:hypothetical protein